MVLAAICSAWVYKPHDTDRPHEPDPAQTTSRRAILPAPSARGCPSRRFVCMCPLRREQGRRKIGPAVVAAAGRRRVWRWTATGRPLASSLRGRRPCGRRKGHVCSSHSREGFRRAAATPMYGPLGRGIAAGGHRLSGIDLRYSRGRDVHPFGAVRVARGRRAQQRASRARGVVGRDGAMLRRPGVLHGLPGSHGVARRRLRRRGGRTDHGGAHH